jgi:hypothetical protein
MNRYLGNIVALIILCGAVPSWAQNFEFTVKHHHTLKDCQGTLKISGDGVEYLTTHAKDSRFWKYEEIRTLEVKSPTEVSIVTYEDQKRWAGKDKVFEFTLLDRKATPELSSFLLARVKRPMEVAVLPEHGVPRFELHVKHLHTITGTTGVLKIYPDKVVYETARQGDSRYWRLSDIERFSQPDRFRFQVVSYVPAAGGPTEVYNFQLMEDLPEGLYDYLWVRLHPSSYYPEVRQTTAATRSAQR